MELGWRRGVSEMTFVCNFVMSGNDHHSDNRERKLCFYLNGGWGSNQIMSIYKCLLSRDIDIDDTHSSETVNGIFVKV